MNNFGEKVSFIWGVADLIRDTFKRGKYQDVILAPRWIKTFAFIHKCMHIYPP
jgi:hypothetical protein